MTATGMIIPEQVFKFNGQARLDTFTVELRLMIDLDRYDDRAIHRFLMALEAIRLHVNGFPFWQRRRKKGRPPTEERTLMISFLLMQLMDLKFRETQGMLYILQDYYAIEKVPDHSVLCRKNRSRRWRRIWERFFSYVMDSLPPRKVVAATDATGYSGRKRSWRETSYAQKARENWVKVHAVVEVGELLVLAYQLTDSNVHESQAFGAAWKNLPRNVRPVRSLADAAYCGEACLAVAREHGATPLHAIKKNARDFRNPKTLYQKMANFAKRWPNRFAALTAKRNHAETVFSMIDSELGYRLRCRSDGGRKNEIRCKLVLFNILQLANRKEFWAR